MKQIFFEKISIKNFLSIANTPVEVDFKRGINIITGVNLDKPDRQNGVGKSSILEAIFFALYGESYRKVDKIDQLCNWSTKKGAEVSLSIKVCENNNTTDILITRRLKPSQVEILINGQNKTLDSISNTNNFINNLIHYNADTFKNCVLMTLNSTESFFQKKKQQKREFIESIFNLECFSNLLKKTKERYSDVQNNFEKKSIRYDEIEHNIHLYNTQKIDFDNQTKNHIQKENDEINLIKSKIDLNNKSINNFNETKHNEKNTELQKSINLIDNKIIEKNNDINQLFEKSANIVTQVNNFKKNNVYISDIKTIDVNLNCLLNELHTINNKLDNISFIQLTQDEIENQAAANNTLLSEQKKILLINNEIVEINTNIKNVENQINKTKNQPNQCPTCKQELSAEHKLHIEQKINDLLLEKQNLNEKLSRASETQNLISTNILNLQNIIKQVETVKQNNNTNTLLKQDLEQQKSKISLKIDVLNENKDIIKIDEQLQPLYKQKQICQNSIVALNNKKKEIQDSLADLQREEQQIKNLININAIYNDNIKKHEQNIYSFKQSNNPFLKLIDEANINKSNLMESLNKLKDELQLLDQAKFVFSEEGVKSFLIKKTLNLFNNRLSHYLKVLDSKYVCFFNEYFEEEIINHLGLNYSYGNLSGAERKVLDFACLFTFMDIRRLQGDVALNVSFYDELLDTSLDVKGINLVLSILQERVDKFSESLFIISHRKEAAKYATGDIINLQILNEITTRI